MPSPARFGARTTTDQVLEGKNLGGRSIIVTGANTGIGYDTARALAAAGASVVIACRNRASGEDATQRIRAAHPDAKARCAVLDLGSLGSVRAFCEALPESRIDVLICNAGLLSPDRGTTADGFERTVGVCHLGHFALATSLLPRLRAAGTPRVVMVSSVSHSSPPQLDFTNLAIGPADYKPLAVYGQAKLCNVLMAAELQRRYGAEGLTACALHPGSMIHTNIGSESWQVRLAMTLARPFAKNIRQGAATTVWAAVHEPAAELAGQYLRDCRVNRASPEARDPAVAARLWELSERWLAAGHP